MINIESNRNNIEIEEKQRIQVKHFIFHPSDGPIHSSDNFFSINNSCGDQCAINEISFHHGIFSFTQMIANEALIMWNKWRPRSLIIDTNVSFHVDHIMRNSKPNFNLCSICLQGENRSPKFVSFLSRTISLLLNFDQNCHW